MLVSPSIDGCNNALLVRESKNHTKKVTYQLPKRAGDYRRRKKYTQRYKDEHVEISAGGRFTMLCPGDNDDGNDAGGDVFWSKVTKRILVVSREKEKIQSDAEKSGLE